ncbi:MAG: response regulator [Anaerolineales bacterium]|nr:response regulator [Anaerolineales bacterium]
MQINILLIGYRENTPSFTNLENTLMHLGELLVLPEKNAMQQILQQEYDVIIVDTSYIDNEILLVSRIHAQQPQARILVLTASPTWRRAREALQAGVIDYIKKSLSEREYASILKDALAKKSPSRHQ